MFQLWRFSPKRLRITILLALFLLSLPVLPDAQGQASEGNCQAFPETGKSVCGSFLQYWQEHGGLPQQGYPISDEFQETSPTDGKPYTVQYFERSVLEHHPENQPPYDVLLSLLGSRLYARKYQQGAPNQQPNNSPGSVLFNETGHRLGGAFLDYWNSHGGLLQQGYPISDEFQEKSDLDGKTYIVQYFERAVFEMHPENQAPYDILLSQLGTFQYRQTYLATPTVEPTPTPQPVPTSPPATTGGDWPMYGRNPGRSSYNGDEKLLAESNLGQMVQRWQAALGSNGNPSSSSPVVANGRVYVGSSALQGDNFYAFDATSGAPSWTANVGYFESCDGVGIGSTAAISGTVLVVGGGDAAYYGLDASTGKQLWRSPMDVGPSGFAWASPLLANGRAYIGIASDCDNPSVRGEVRALDMLTGKPLASRPFVPEGQAGAGIWNSPALSPDGNVLIVATGEDFGGYDGPYNRALVSLDPVSLDIQQANKQGDVNGDQDFATSPIVFMHDGRTLVFAGHKDDNVYLYDLGNISEGPVWQRAASSTIGMLPAYTPDNGGTLLFVAQTELYAVDPATGADRWQPVTVGNVHGNMAVANGLVFLNAGSEGLKILNLSNGELLRTIVPADAGKSFSGVAAANGFVYWVAGSHLNAWSLPQP